MTFQYSAANDQVTFNLNDSIKSTSNESSFLLNTKPGFIRIKLIKLDPAPSFNNISTNNNNNSSSTSKLKNLTNGNQNHLEYYNSENGNKSNSNHITSHSSSSPLFNSNNNNILDPYCAVNVKEMIKLDGDNGNHVVDSIDYKKKKSYYSFN